MPLPPAAAPNQFALLRQRRFAPFFWTQFLGAANDNLFKFAFTVMVTYQVQSAWLTPQLAGLVIGAIFILPFLLFSATSGQLADKLDKTRLIRFVKALEIGVMLLAAWGFWAVDVPLLLGCVFLMGLHSTLFGPVKFAYLPQHLSDRELTGGNGMVEMGTFVAILLGQVAGGLLVAMPGVGRQLVSAACVLLAVGGRLVAQRVPASPSTDPGLRIHWNPFSETWRNLRLANEDVVVFRSLLGISWMWFFGAVFLSQFPSFAKEVLHGDERVASLLLVVFSIGIGTGSLLCEAFSKRHVELGLVPLGAIGMSAFAVDLYFASRSLAGTAEIGVAEFLSAPAHWRVMLDLALLSLFAGVYSVPMYALIQLRARPSHRARIIAANNILNALFMIVSAVAAGALLAAHVTIPQVFLLTGLLNAVVTGTLFLRVPEYLLRFVALVLARVARRLRLRGEEHIPAEGPALLVCNRVGHVDALLLLAASSRPIRLVIDRRAFATPLFGGFLRLAKAIPISPAPAIDDRAVEAGRAVLAAGGLLCVFLDGGTADEGTLGQFAGATMPPVPVVPLALRTPRGPRFAGRGGRRRTAHPVELVVGEAIRSEGATPARLREHVARLLAS